MARKKTSLEYIASDNTRRATLKKRRRGLIKKVSELATLCDVRACAVIYGPDQVQPEVWPNEHDARKTLQCFKEMPELEQSKKMMDQERFLKQCLSKHDDQLRRLRSEIHELEMTALMVDGLAGARSLRDVSFRDASAFTNFLAGKAKAVRERIEAAAAATAAKAQMEMVPVEACTEQALLAQVPPNWFPEASHVPNMFGSDIWDGGAGTGTDHMVDLMQPYCMDLWNIDPTLHM